MKYFALTGLGNIVSIGECKDFDEADQKASELGYDASWLGDAETFKRWEKHMAQVKEEWSESEELPVDDAETDMEVNIQLDDNGNCEFCGEKCWLGQGCDEQMAGGFNNN
jgi:hypothetical protein